MRPGSKVVPTRFGFRGGKSHSFMFNIPRPRHTPLGPEKTEQVVCGSCPPDRIHRANNKCLYARHRRCYVQHVARNPSRRTRAGVVHTERRECGKAALWQARRGRTTCLETITRPRGQDDCNVRHWGMSWSASEGSVPRLGCPQFMQAIGPRDGRSV